METLRYRRLHSQRHLRAACALQQGMKWSPAVVQMSKQVKDIDFRFSGCHMYGQNKYSAGGFEFWRITASLAADNVMCGD